jgi:hypothetical protein
MARSSCGYEGTLFENEAIPSDIANCIGVKLNMSGTSKLPNVPELCGLNKNEKDRVDYFLKITGKK